MSHNSIIIYSDYSELTCHCFYHEQHFDWVHEYYYTFNIDNVDNPHHHPVANLLSIMPKPYHRVEFAFNEFFFSIFGKTIRQKEPNPGQHYLMHSLEFYYDEHGTIHRGVLWVEDQQQRQFWKPFVVDPVSGEKYLLSSQFQDAIDRPRYLRF